MRNASWTVCPMPYWSRPHNYHFVCFLLSSSCRCYRCDRPLSYVNLSCQLNRTFLTKSPLLKCTIFWIEKLLRSIFRDLFCLLALLFCLLLVAAFAEAQAASQHDDEERESGDCNRWDEVRIVIDQIVDAVHLEVLEVSHNRRNQFIAIIQMKFCREKKILKLIQLLVRDKCWKY